MAPSFYAKTQQSISDLGLSLENTYSPRRDPDMSKKTVKLKTSMASPTESWKSGSIIDLDADEADRFVKGGLAVYVESEKAAAKTPIEKAVQAVAGAGKRKATAKPAAKTATKPKPVVQEAAPAPAADPAE